jgi:hypothetical protein
MTAQPVGAAMFFEVSLIVILLIIALHLRNAVDALHEVHVAINKLRTRGKE